MLLRGNILPGNQKSVIFEKEQLEYYKVKCYPDFYEQVYVFLQTGWLWVN